MSKSRNTKEIKIFNKEGLIKLRDFYNINKKARKNEFIIPVQWLDDLNLTESLQTPKYIDLDKASSFPNRFEFGKYFYNLLNQDLVDTELNGQGLWEWLALYYFDSMFSASKGWKLSRYDNYIYLPHKGLRAQYNMPVAPNWVEHIATGHRHCTRGPYLAFESFGKDAELLLNAQAGPHVFGDLAEQFLARRWTKDFKIIWKVASQIFILPDGSRKPGWSTSGFGSLRRFMPVIDSVMYSHNINKMKATDLKNELGAEFT